MASTLPELPLTWWLTGLPAAGKTTLACGLNNCFIDQDRPFVLLDGDVLRAGLCSDLGFSPQDRTENIRRVAEVAKVMNDSGVSVAVALVSPFRNARAMARQIIGTHRFIESYVSTSIALCSARDPKGLYARARIDPGFLLTGPNAPYEPPECPEVVVNTEIMSIDAAIEILVVAAERKIREAIDE